MIQMEDLKKGGTRGLPGGVANLPGRDRKENAGGVGGRFLSMFEEDATSGGRMPALDVCTLLVGADEGPGRHSRNIGSRASCSQRLCSSGDIPGGG